MGPFVLSGSVFLIPGECHLLELRLITLCVLVFFFV
jgi:hypothetical protein